MNTEYIRKIAQRLIDLATDLDALNRGENLPGLFDEFGAPPVDMAGTEAEIKRTINFLLPQTIA